MLCSLLISREQSQKWQMRGRWKDERHDIANAPAGFIPHVLQRFSFCEPRNEKGVKVTVWKFDADAAGNPGQALCHALLGSNLNLFNQCIQSTISKIWMNEAYHYFFLCMFWLGLGLYWINTRLLLRCENLAILDLYKWRILIWSKIRCSSPKSLHVNFTQQ